MSFLDRRAFLLGSAALACTIAPAFSAQAGKRLPRVIRPGNNMAHVRQVSPSLYEMELDGDDGVTGSIDQLDPDELPPPESDIDFPIEFAEDLIDARFRAQTLKFSSIPLRETIVVDAAEHFLYHFGEQGIARRYGVGVGRAGFAWSGEAIVGMKRRWPRWVPPREMVVRDKKARRWAKGQPGGPDNPLGARALYLHQNGKDTLYRIHGTNEPRSIGKSVSSGCVRMLNEHIAELYERVKVGTRVIVLPAPHATLSDVSG